MTTFYSGYYPILQGDNANLWVNTYTGELGVYSNWSLMSTVHAFAGAPDNNRTPGGGAYQVQPDVHGQGIGALTPNNAKWMPGVRIYGEGDVLLSRMFLGLDQAFNYKVSLKNAGNPVQNDFYGRYMPDLYRGLEAVRVFKAGYGHKSWAAYTGYGAPSTTDTQSAYALWSNYYYAGLVADQALQTSTLGHKERYPSDTINVGQLGAFDQPTGPAESFGAFEPYLYKGLTTTKSSPLNDTYNPGHPYWAPSITADIMPQDYGEIPPPRTTPNHYGDEHTREYFGLLSCRALAV